MTTKYEAPQKEYNPKNPDLYKQVEIPPLPIPELNVIALDNGLSTIGDGALQSRNFRTGASGYRLRSDGTFEAREGVFSGTFNIGGTIITINSSEDIQNNLDKVFSEGGGTVYLQPGTYLLDADINIPSGVVLEGVARDTVIIDCNNAYNINLSGTDVYEDGNVSITNGTTTVTGTSTVFTSDMAGRYIWLQDFWYEIASVTSDTELEITEDYEGDTLTNDTTYIISAINISPILKKVTIKNSTGSGIISNYSRELEIDDIYVTGCGVGIECNYIQYPRIYCSSLSNGKGAVLKYVVGYLINFSEFAYSTIGAGIEMEHCFNASFFNTSCESNAGDGLNMINCTDTAFISSSFMFNSGNGIELESSCTDLQFVANSISYNDDDGLKLTATSDRNTVSSTSIIENGGYGINIVDSGCENTQIIAPAFDNNASGNIDDNGTGTVIIGISALKITYTGTPLIPLIFSIVNNSITTVPNVAVAGQQTYYATTGPTIDSFSYGEASASSGDRLETLSFDDLVGVNSSFTPTGCAALTSLSAPKLKKIISSFNPNTMASLTTLSFPELVTVGGSFLASSMASLTTLSFPELVTVGADFFPKTMASLTTLSFPKLEKIGTSFNPSAMAALTTVAFPELTFIGFSFTVNSLSSCTSLSFAKLEKIGNFVNINNMTSLTTISLPSMISYGSTIAANTSLGALSSVTLGTIGTLKSIAGATINLSGQAIPSANVNAILALLVSLDGTNGTTTWGTGKTLTINGGTNGAPTGQGATDKATLQARGATITTN